MILTNVGRDELRRLKVGETGFFTLPDTKAVATARVTAYQLRKDGYAFERLRLKEPLTIAFRRIK